MSFQVMFVWFATVITIGASYRRSQTLRPCDKSDPHPDIPIRYTFTITDEGYFHCFYKVPYSKLGKVVGKDRSDFVGRLIDAAHTCADYDVSYMPILSSQKINKFFTKKARELNPNAIIFLGLTVKQMKDDNVYVKWQNSKESIITASAVHGDSECKWKWIDVRPWPFDAKGRTYALLQTSDGNWISNETKNINDELALFCHSMIPVSSTTETKIDNTPEVASKILATTRGTTGDPAHGGAKPNPNITPPKSKGENNDNSKLALVLTIFLQVFETI